MEYPLQAALDWLSENEEADVARLTELVAIESVASDPDRKDAVRESVMWMEKELRRVGFTDLQVHETPTHPALTGHLRSTIEGAPTVLVYGHVDVQPVEPLNEWLSPPYKVTEREGKLWGRGVTDDKGQLLMYSRAFEAIRESGGEMPVNVIVLIDGEEEVGSPSLAGVLEANPWIREASVALVSDSPALGLNLPAVGYSLRGEAYVEVSVTALSNDLHSGQFGGAVPNAATILARMISELHDGNGRVTVPGFYDDVDELSADERERLAALPFDERKWLDTVGAVCGVGEEGFSALERTWTRPTLELTGFGSGHTGPGPKTIVPANATAKLSARLVSSQDPEKISALIVDRIKKIAPESVKVEISYTVAAKPVITPTDSPAVEAALEALAESWKSTPFLIRDGGTIPAVSTLQNSYNLPTLLLGFGCPDENKHAPNEWLPLDHFRRGPDAIVRLLPKLAKVL
jgi:Acetylornithine deacetylase/Succinyl-diaminopimelate desuccinylase and related deacylases